MSAEHHIAGVQNPFGPVRPITASLTLQSPNPQVPFPSSELATPAFSPNLDGHSGAASSGDTLGGGGAGMGDSTHRSDREAGIEEAAIDGKDLAVHISGVRRQQEGDGAGHLLGQTVAALRHALHPLPGRTSSVWTLRAEGGVSIGPGATRVDADAVRTDVRWP